MCERVLARARAGLAVGADSTWTLQNWTALLDPLLAAGATKQRASVKLSQLSGFTTFKASAEGTS
ncbi:hypothetical protein EON67_12125 [archaeon]|nr:MAG: hypothetical protein EON67_12125 [archaeon]